MTTKLVRTETDVRGGLISEKIYHANEEIEGPEVLYWISDTTYVCASNLNRDILTMSETIVRWNIARQSE